MNIDVLIYVDGAKINVWHYLNYQEPQSLDIQ